MLLAEQIIVVRAIACICHRIFGIEAMKLMKLLHEWNEAIHIRPILEYICNDYVFVSHANLNIVCGQ